MALINWRLTVILHLSGIESASGEDSSGIYPGLGEDSSGIKPASGKDESGEDESGRESSFRAGMVCRGIFFTNLI